MKPSLWHIILFALVSACSEQADKPSQTTESPHLEHPSANGPEITGANIPRTEKNIQVNQKIPPLSIEKAGNVATLPKSYPETWVIVDEASFFNMFGGKVIILDIAETKHAKRIKGLMDKNLLGNFTQSRTRNEFYIMESFHERGSRGKKTDILAIYDKQSLSIKKEIIWPKANRLQALPERYAMALSDDERFLYSANFDPAASFSVIDLDTYEIVEEIATAGCVLTYPIGDRGVASICSNGSILSTQLHADGTLKSQSRSQPFFDTTHTPVFEHAVYVNGIAYFPSFTGLLHSFDMRGKKAEYLGVWDMLSEEQKSAGWRPSGLALNDFDDNGLMYTIFQPNGGEGTQTHGGTQVWVYDVLNKKRIRVIDTPNWAISIAVTRGENPLLVVTNGELNLDIFDAQSGKFLHTVSDFGNSTPLLVHKSY